VRIKAVYAVKIAIASPFISPRPLSVGTIKKPYV
jgi:hypothetical protein